MHEDILNFWFQEIDPKMWFTKDSEFDDLIRSRFLDIHTKAKNCELFKWRSEAKGRLAEIIILDQFSRNLFRESPEAFGSDSLALALAQEAVSLGMDEELNNLEKSFLYMPYMHSESLAIHEVAIELYSKEGLENNLDFESKHKEIIERFGRYPHRNQILGRQSSAEEIDFLQQEGSSF